MEQLLKMGFPQELATQALAATGGKSTLKATEWILDQKSTSSSLSPPPPTPSPSPSPSQPRLDRFFQSKTPLPFPHQNQTQTQTQNQTQTQTNPSPQSPQNTPPPKRHKPSPSHSHPLSDRMRPRTIDDIVGQDHLLSPTSLLPSALRCCRLPSIILWGPPGTGKTSIARAISNSNSSPDSSYRFVPLTAVTAGVKDVRDAVEEARRWKRSGKRTLLFLDEVHRFNKSQQDSFLPVIEDGSIIFIGATTENPSFHLVTPLLSRCQVLRLNPLQPCHVAALLHRAAGDPENGLPCSAGLPVKVEEEAIDFLSHHCDGDARVALNALEAAATSAAARIAGGNSGDNEIAASVTLDDAKEALQCKHLAYDRAGEEHYNLISALHKSMRGSNADAAIYWLARMLEGGEEPLYIARRLIRFASEDVGLADPSALGQAVACYQACHFLGMPECNVNLAQCVAYLALAPKSVAVYRAMGAAQKVVRESGGQIEGVPLHLRNAPTKLMKEMGYSKGYIYPPDNPSSSASQKYLPPSLQGYKFLDWPPTIVPDGNPVHFGQKG